MRASIAGPIAACALAASLLLGYAAPTTAQERRPSAPRAGISAPELPHQPLSTACLAVLRPMPIRFGEPAPVLLSAIGQQELARKHRVQGAVVGASLGALIGGFGFAAVTYLANDRPGKDYWPLGLVVGAVGGAAVGGVLGAIVGVKR